MHAAVCLLRAGQPRSAGDAAKLGQFIGQFSWVTGDPIGLKGLFTLYTNFYPKLFSTANTAMQEYCQWEPFKAHCGKDEVVLIDDAVYGRMRYGRCISEDQDHVGCYRNVRALADIRCSGRRECQIDVPDKLFDGTKPCREDFKLYLMASYTCLKGRREDKMASMFIQKLLFNRFHSNTDRFNLSLPVTRICMRQLFHCL